MYDNISRYSQRDLEALLTEQLGSRYTEYRAAWKAAGPDTPPAFPVHMDFELNDRCNQRCSMCPRNEAKHPNINYELNKGTVLEFEDYARVIDEGAAKGLWSVNLGAFAEPLLHPRAFDMVAHAHDKGIVDSRLITNGILLDKHIDDIFDSGLVNLFVSLDAFSEEKFREVRGPNFQRVRDNLLAFLAERERRRRVLPIVRVSFIDMNVNREEKQGFIDFWGPKVDFIDIQVFDDFNVDVTRPYDAAKTKKWDCGSPWGRLAVLSCGDILPCCSFFGYNVPVGNIKDMSIEEAWNSEALAGIRRGILSDDLPNCSICQRIGE